MADTKNFISLNPDDYTSGIIDDVTVKLEHKFVLYDYGGKSVSGEAEPCLQINMVDAETGEEYQPQYLSAGKSSDWVPSEDGLSLVPISGRTSLVKISKVAIYFTEMINAGFPKNKLSGSLAPLNGVVAHMIRKELPKYGNVSATHKAKDGKEYAKTILVPDRIISLPGEKKASSAGAKGSAAKTDATAAATEFVVQLLSEKGSFQKKDIPAAAMKLDASIRAEVLKLVYGRDSFLASGGGGLWTYEGGEVKLAA